jgi:dTDP-4-dehydrorhamnose 3,5-epimerase
LKFTSVPLEGACLIDIEPIADNRGFFARSWCRQEFERHDLNASLVQCNISFNKKRGTLRGLHYQEQPYGEAKLIRCSAGAIYDVIVDLRPASRSYKRWFAVELTAANRRMLYVPEGFAHGFQTLADDTEVLYQMSGVYRKDCARGIRWNDPALAVDWPMPNPILSDKDQSYLGFLG